MSIAETKLQALINAGLLPPIFSDIGVSHGTNKIASANIEWKSGGLPIPFVALVNGARNLTQRPKNAAFAVGVKDGPPDLGADETRRNIVMRPISPFPSISGDKILHLDGANLAGNEGSITDWVDSSNYLNRFLPYQSDKKPTVSPLSRDDYPRIKFSGVDSYIYCDDGDNWDVGNEGVADPVADHLFSVTGSTVYISLKAEASAPPVTSNYGAAAEEHTSAAESTNIAEGVSTQIGMVNTSGSGAHPEWPLFPKFYIGTSNGSTFTMTDATSVGVSGSQGNLILFESENNVDIDVTISECIIYAAVHNTSEVESMLKYLHYKHKSDL